MNARRLALAALPLFCAGMASAEPAFSLRSETLLYDNATEAWSRSPYNRVAHPADHSINLDLRPDASWREDALDLTLRPRFSASTEPGRQRSKSWLNEGWLRWRAAPGLSLQGGREALLWGPSMFWNPSNPFFGRNNKENPKREIAGHDFLRGRWQFDDAWSASLISQLDHGHAGLGTGPQRIDALKFDWVGDSASAAALVSAEPGRTPGWQGWAQWTASDALILYGEAAWRRDAIRMQPVAAATPTGWQLVADAPARTLKTVLGAGYTFANNWTLNAEWWRDGGGLTAQQADTWGRASDALVMQSPGLADAQLGALVDAVSPLRRHYLGLQLMNGSDAATGWTLRYTRNLDDASGEAYAMVKRDLGDVWQLWANLMLRHGDAHSEYGRWIRASAMLGVSWFH